MPDMDELSVPMEPRGFLVSANGKVPAIGDTGVTTQFFCPLLKGACIKQACMMWVELYAGSQRVAHCAFYWNAVQMTDIKSQLSQLVANGSPKSGAQ